MADTGLTVWAPGLWADGFWATDLWSSGAAAPAAASSISGGGALFYEFDLAQAQRRRRKQLEDEAREEAKRIPEPTTREIAQLLRVQEAKDADRTDLERIQSIADRYVKRADSIGIPARTRAAIYNAHEQRTINALEQMRREIERMYEEEEAAQIAAILMDD